LKTYRIFEVVIAAAGPSLRSGQYLTWVAPSLWRSRRSRSGDRGFMVEVVRRAGSCGSCSETGRTTPARRSWRQSWLLLRLVGRRRPERLDGIARSVAARELSAPDSRWLIRFWRVGAPKKVRARYEHPPPNLWCTGRLMCAPGMRIASVISAAFSGAPGPRAASSLAVKPPVLAQEAD
jgi:hypothetical protein